MRPEERLDTCAMAKDLTTEDRRGYAFESNADLLEQLKETVLQDAGGLIVFFTNGSSMVYSIV